MVPATRVTNVGVLVQAQAWNQSYPGWGWRVYRTKAGLHLLATHWLFDPEGAPTEQVLTRWALTSFTGGFAGRRSASTPGWRRNRGVAA
jgi:hypothetical protein